jgi:toxin ParE1/3/4
MRRSKASSLPAVADVRLRAGAEADLTEILRYSVETFGAAVGEDYLRSFTEAFDLLRRHPLAGALRTEIEPPIRCLPHRRHRIFYDVEGDSVWIARAMDAQGRFEG